MRPAAAPVVSLSPADARYTSPAIALHWLLALLILGTLAVGLVMTSLPLTPTRLRLFNWHKWAGIGVLILSLLRLLWRSGHPPPPALPVPRWQQRAARSVHALLYLLCVAVPLAGWAYSSAAGFPVVLFGVLPLPDWVAADRELAATLKPLHHALAYSLAVAIALHVGAACKHQFVDRDGLLRRMWPRRR
jgi:cytochrome b561